MTYNFLSATILLFIIIDPLGNIPLFASALRNVPPLRRKRVLLREVGIAFGILLVFMYFGEGFLRLMHLTDFSLQMAGGIVLFVIALRMVFPRSATEADEMEGEPFIVPMAVPALAGPSAMATVMLMASQSPERMTTWIAALFVTMSLSLVVFLLAEYILKWVGPAVVQAFERLMGLLLVAVATDMVLRAVASFMKSL